MPQKMFLVVVCMFGFLIPVSFAVLSVNMPSTSEVDPGLPEGFKPLGTLTLYYVGGG